MKLKTLKDFEFKCHEEGYEDECSHEGGDDVKTGDLRQEAINWIKQLEKCSKEDGSCSHDNDFHYLFGNIKEGDALSQNECVALKDWIKHFFNISSEDLK